MNMEQTEGSETSAHKFQTPENNPEESIQHLEHGESLKSRNNVRSNPSNQSEKLATNPLSRGATLQA